MLQPMFKGTGLLKLICITFVSPTIPAIDGSVEGSTVNAAFDITAGVEIWRVGGVDVEISMFPFVES